MDVQPDPCILVAIDWEGPLDVLMNWEEEDAEEEGGHLSAAIDVGLDGLDIGTLVHDCHRVVGE